MRLTKEVTKKLERAYNDCPFLGEKTVRINKSVTAILKAESGLHGKTEITLFKNKKYMSYFGCFSFNGCLNKLKAYKVGKGLPARAYWD